MGDRNPPMVSRGLLTTQGRRINTLPGPSASHALPTETVGASGQRQIDPLPGLLLLLILTCSHQGLLAPCPQIGKVTRVENAELRLNSSPRPLERRRGRTLRAPSCDASRDHRFPPGLPEDDLLSPRYQPADDPATQGVEIRHPSRPHSAVTSASHKPLLLRGRDASPLVAGLSFDGVRDSWTARPFLSAQGSELVRFSAHSPGFRTSRDAPIEVVARATIGSWPVLHLSWMPCRLCRGLRVVACLDTSSNMLPCTDLRLGPKIVTPLCRGAAAVSSLFLRPSKPRRCFSLSTSTVDLPWNSEPTKKL
eukprot:scaffold3190_cov409-Prasinococcus_capsulatus_cf.AAC.10